MQLKPTAASIIEGVPGKGKSRIGAEIPLIHYLTIELEMLEWEYPAYLRTHTANNKIVGSKQRVKKTLWASAI